MIYIKFNSLKVVESEGIYRCYSQHALEKVREYSTKL